MTKANDTPLDRAHASVVTLVENFAAHELTFLGNGYSEAQARIDFIDPLFEALGWDVNHRIERNPFEQEVVVERNVTTGQGQKRADYAFYLKPIFRDVRFFVEAKKPLPFLSGDVDAIFQTIRYGWSAGAILSILTNFYDISILDCRSRPDPETAESRILLRFHYTELRDVERFAKFYWLFSCEAHETGAYERYCAGLPKPRGASRQLTLFKMAVQPVDEAFLNDLEEYRERLARMFKKADHALNGEEITELAQRTLDRLIFLRFLEDKLIETKISVAKFGITGSSWGDFIAASRRLDGIYNGIVYKKHSILDDRNFSVDDGAFSDICTEISDKNSPYDYNAIPIHILGSIYERFLGKVIIATDKRITVELKPDVRKAGGVYYTPEYIVSYIVANTVGTKLAGKTPKQIQPLRFVDIACGSGSFLLGIFDVIIKYETSWYNSNPEIAKKDGCIQLPDNTWRLSLHQKRQILLNNIFGVDIDQQAVEVTQLSLFLKLLEDETTSSAYKQQSEFEETLLPSLNNNIQRGNSLVQSDIPRELFDLERREVILPFDFRTAFKNVFVGDKGFDAIVGNPPYIKIQTMSDIHPATANYVKQHYQSATKGNFDIYSVFVERGMQLINEEGLLGFIVPNKFLRTDYGETLRLLLSKRRAVRRVIDFGSSQVFKATTYTCMLFLSRKPVRTVEYATCDADQKALLTLSLGNQPASDLSGSSWSFSSGATFKLTKRMADGSDKLLDLPAGMNRGSSTGADDAFLVGEGSAIEPEILRTPLFASDFSRFEFLPKSKLEIIFPYELHDGAYQAIPEKRLKAQFPKAYQHLQSHKKELQARAAYREWYSYSAPRSLLQHDSAMIAVPLLANRGLASLIPASKRSKMCPMASGGLTVTLGAKCGYDPRFVLGVLNSKVLFWYLEQLSNVFRGGWITCTKQYFGSLPIKRVDLRGKVGRAQHDEIVEIVQLLSR